VVAATVLSHFVLDVVVHVAGLPVLGPESWRLGLGLWRHPGVELAIECALAGLGWWAFIGSPGGPTGRARSGLGGLVALCALLTIMGGLTTTPPPGPAAMALVSLGTLAAVTALAAWLDRPVPAR
jgi:hypothetical protein